MAAFVAACLHAIVLPYQWCSVGSFATDVRSVGDGADAASTSKAAKADEEAADAVAPNYVWAAPFQLLAHLPTDLQAQRTWLRDSALYGVAVAGVASAIVYPMDWGREYQTWPLPTLYAVLCASVVAQLAEMLSSVGRSERSGHKKIA